MFDKLFSLCRCGTAWFSVKRADTVGHLDNPTLRESHAFQAGGGPSRKRTLVSALASFCFASIACAGTTYYVATNGSNGNTGLSTNSAWSLSYALATVGPSNTIIVLPGTYTGYDPIIVRHSYTTLQSQTKWAARFIATGTGQGVSIWPSPISNVIIDGFEIANSGMYGVELYGSNCVVRNCWIHNSGQSHGVNVGSGIFCALPYYNNLFENNLLEYNGYSLGYDHGMYVSGTNCILRNNVCRYNLGMGISIYDNHGGASQNCQIYNNLLYGNYGKGPSQSDYQLGVNDLNVPNTTNYVFGNTIISTNAYNTFVEWTTVCFTNNILISSGPGIQVYSPSGTVSFATGDFNLAPSTLTTTGAHDVMTGIQGFVNTSNGLYWLTASSRARGAAFTTACSGTDFFGNTRSVVSDIGAFQYNDLYPADTRVLDPSQFFPNFWLVLSRPLPPLDLHFVLSTNQ